MVYLPLSFLIYFERCILVSLLIVLYITSSGLSIVTQQVHDGLTFFLIIFQELNSIDIHKVNTKYSILYISLIMNIKMYISKN